MRRWPSRHQVRRLTHTWPFFQAQLRCGPGSQGLCVRPSAIPYGWVESLCLAIFSKSLREASRIRRVTATRRQASRCAGRIASSWLFSGLRPACDGLNEQYVFGLWLAVGAI